MPTSAQHIRDRPGREAGPPQTIAQALRRTADAHADLPGLRTPDDAISLAWSDVRERSDALARGLKALGVERGDAVALMLRNRPEFQLADLAALTLGAVPFSLYQTLAPDQIEYQLDNSGARLLITEQAFLAQVAPVAERMSQLEHLVVLDGEAPEGAVRWSEIEQPEGEDLASLAEEGRPEDVVTLIYTSGTTGPPKGVELTHANVIADAAALEEVLRLEPGDRVISWLPTAHVAERMANYYVPVLFGLTITCCDDPGKIAAVLPQVRPHWFFAVPRVWEKLKAALEAQGVTEPAELPDDAKADVRSKLGLDAAKCLHSGGAPIPAEVLEFFHALGAEVGQLWGMSELCGAATLTRPGAVRVDTVGEPLPGVELRVADDGELLVRGPIVMRGYRDQPEKTAEALDADGWLRTGDLAAIDDDGHVRIVGRKKEIIVNAAGKNMSPANIETELKSAGPLIGQAIAIGDGRPYNVALVTLDPDGIRAFCQRHGIEDGSLEKLADDDRVIEEVQQEVDQANERLARVEQIKKFKILPTDWEPGGDELTPTMKLKRQPIAEKYAEEIEALYAG